MRPEPDKPLVVWAGAADDVGAVYYRAPRYNGDNYVSTPSGIVKAEGTRGPLTIVSVTGDVIEMRSKDGQTVVFDASALRFVD